MTTHPNRSKKTPKEGRTPTPEEIKKARALAGLTQPQAADVIGVTTSGWARWEGNERRMHPAFWELFLIKTGLKESDLSTPEAMHNK